MGRWVFRGTGAIRKAPRVATSGAKAIKGAEGHKVEGSGESLEGSSVPKVLQEANRHRLTSGTTVHVGLEVFNWSKLK